MDRDGRHFWANRTPLIKYARVRQHLLVVVSSILFLACCNHAQAARSRVLLQTGLSPNQPGPSRRNLHSPGLIRQESEQSSLLQRLPWPNHD
jgi:hypothetical protein